ncbi:cytochrome c [Ectothiorhodospiraceae bacterium WFHF3C12]|nr:cytochrome c [Ectothiorhodospiraceae bacterium WFHF3C12]
MIKRLKLGMAALALVVSLPVAAVDRGDPAAGERKSATCAGCHGQAGRSTNPQYPILAGQYADYLYRTLVDYKTGARQNAVMKGMVANLSEEDMWDLAAYYAAQSSDLYTMDR